MDNESEDQRVGSQQSDKGKKRRRRSGKANLNAKSASRASAHRVKTAKKRKSSSTLWLERQLNDPYVQRAKQEGYVSRAAYKLLELNDKFDLIGKDSLIVDLGAAPGGWVQAASRLGANRIIGIDLLPIVPVDHAVLLQKDVRDGDTIATILGLLGAPADLVLSDMAPDTIGHKSTDHLRIVALVETAIDVALRVLKPGGHFVAKTFQGGAGSELIELLRQNFHKVRHAKPESSRTDSSETYLIALSRKMQVK